MSLTFNLPVVTVNALLVSVFSEELFTSSLRGGMVLTEQISAINLRLRKSAAGYKTDWHVAGDPTLIIIQQGVLRITLRDESFCDFSAGGSFIAKDFLPQEIDFDPLIHGHRAEVIGEQELQAVHVKLA